MTHAEPMIADRNLAATLQAHVAAVQARDLAALEKTLATADALDLILPNGKRMTTRAEFVDLHREWFKETNWTWTFEPLSVTATDKLAVITGRTRYEEHEDGKTTVGENWLSLTFLKEPSGWRLVRDQNTRMPSP